MGCRSVDECVQSRHKTLALILGKTIKSRADRRDLHFALAGQSESPSSSVCVGRNLVSPLGQMPPSAAGWSQADRGGLLGDIFFLPSQWTACFVPLLAYLLPPPRPLSSIILWVSHGRVLNLETLPVSLCLVPSRWGRQHAARVFASGFDSRILHPRVLWTLPLHVSEISTARWWIIAKIKQTGSWKGLGR